MTAINDLLRWPDGLGWLVLSGGDDTGSELRARALRLIALNDGAIAYIGISESSADATLDDLEDLGAPTGYLVNVMMEDDDTLHNQLESAGMVMIDADEPTEALRSSLVGAADDAIRAAHLRGAVVLAEGANAALFGARLAAGDRLKKGLDWLANALILPGVVSLAESPVAQQALSEDDGAIVVGIGAGSALALGPGGLIETWGARQVTIALGRAYQD